jgi:hypothetical protein
MKDKEDVKKFLANTYNNCQKRFKKNQVSDDLFKLYSKTIGQVVLAVFQSYRLKGDYMSQISVILVLYSVLQDS